MENYRKKLVATNIIACLSNMLIAAEEVNTIYTFVWKLSV